MHFKFCVLDCTLDTDEYWSRTIDYFQKGCVQGHTTSLNLGK